MASGGYVKIYSNDGATLLFTSTNFYSVTDAMTITETGVKLTNETYTYSGEKKFIGLARTSNKTEAGYEVGYSGAIGDFTFYIVEGNSNNITDLTGTTWYVPSGWEATAGYGVFSIDILNLDTNLTGIGMLIGYGSYVPNDNDDGFKPLPEENAIIGGAVMSAIHVSFLESFTIKITGGADATNPKLIAWLSEYGELQTPSKSITFDISTLGLSSGTHEITARSIASGYNKSPESNAVSYTVYPTLEAPTISIRDDTLTITDTSGVATAYSIYSNGVEVIGTTSLTNDLTKLELAEGTHTITVVAHASGYRDSAPSNEATYVVDSEEIAFTINGAAYQAEEGMTWAQWCDSDYNTNGTFYHTGTDDIRPQNGGCVQTSEGVTVCGSDVIKNKEAYRLAGT